MVEERHPLKQGLKQVAMFIKRESYKHVEERHPLKQGLKHSVGEMVVGCDYG